MLRYAVAAVLGLVVSGSGFAQPQPPVSATRPTYSPYLNLLRGGTLPGVNYYGLVRPEMQFRQQANSLQQQLNSTNQNLQNFENQLLQPGEQPNLPGTGHGVVFNQPFRYFNRLAVGGSGGTGGTGTGGFAGARPTTSSFAPVGGLYAGSAVRGGGAGAGMARPAGGTHRSK